LRGEGESAVQRAFLDYLQSGMTYYDLGATIGIFSLLAARLVVPQGYIAVFEPDPVVFQRLRLNWPGNLSIAASATSRGPGRIR
jgi:FkbM family methyltransferase